MHGMWKNLQTKLLIHTGSVPKDYQMNAQL